MDDYYVYGAYDDEKVWYIGSGRGSRINHVNSGKSHSKLLNKHVLQIGELKLRKIAEGMSNIESLEFEQECIDELDPPYNIAKKVIHRTVKQPAGTPQYSESEPLTDGYNGWQVFADDFFKGDPCQWFYTDDPESIANYQMRIVDEDKTFLREAAENNWTVLSGPREPFDWEK